MSRIAENYRQLAERLAECARRNGRAPDEVKLVGVTKYVGFEQTQELVEAGCRHLGEG